MRGSLPLMVFALDTEENAKRLADYFGVAPKPVVTNATFPITGDQLKEIFPTTEQSRCNEVAELINKYSDKFEINTPLRMAHFLGQVGIESARFEAFGARTGENPCYKKTNIAWKHSAGRAGWIANKTWVETPISEGCDDYTDDKKKKRKHPNWDTVDDVPSKYICSKSNPSNVAGKALLSYVYRCEGGNGDEASRDGFRYRGHGVMQLTWKKQYVEFDSWLQTQGYQENYKKVVSDPDVAFADPDIDMISAMRFWQKNKCNDTADDLPKGTSESDFKDITKKINSGLNHNHERWEIFNKSISLLKK